jgi:hypothetical protein
MDRNEAYSTLLAKDNVHTQTEPAKMPGLHPKWSEDMRSTIDVFVLRHDTEIPPELANPDWPVSLRLLPAGAERIADFAKSPRASQLADGENELVALVSAADRALLRSVAISGYSLASVTQSAGPDFVASVNIEQVDTNSVFDPTAGLRATLGMRILLAPRAGHGPIVFRRSKLRQIGPLRPVSEPVWDWLIRAARAGEKINASPMPETGISQICRLPLLAPNRPTPEADWLRGHLADFTFSEFGVGAASEADETAVRAGFYQWHDFLDESHDLSQSIEGEGENQLGDYWHAIMHRREPDYSNAKYWFRRIGNQPIWRELRFEADGILAKCGAPDAARWRQRLQAGSKWDPFAFVDLCEECAADETTELALAARRIQYAEMSMLVGTLEFSL